jgi:hypothetical protein
LLSFDQLGQVFGKGETGFPLTPPRQKAADSDLSD